ncbi:MAG TPA: YlxR family protein [Mycobacterium sp.]|nr:YlxR family protein [Mycobacterium sp.]
MRPNGPDTGPVRTCIGCRKRELAAELLRAVAVIDGNGQCAVTVDTTASLPGRGAWLHLDRQCVQMAVRRRAFVRALRITGSPDTSAVVDYVEQFGAPDHHGTENR